MRLTVNGRQREVGLPEPATVADLLTELGAHPMVVVELNGKIVDRHRFNEAVLSDNDLVEIVHMVGGGTAW